MSELNKVAVIGSGVMGSGIAAQIANAGVDVLLLDVVPKDAKDSKDKAARNKIADDAVSKLLKTNPAPLMHKRNIKRISTGNIDDNLKDIKDCDWVIEVVIERLDIKQDLYKKIAKHRKKGAVVSSNTSTLPLAQLTQGMDADMAKHFMITHFFNPPRYMRLLEVVRGDKTSTAAAERIEKFADVRLGKSIVACNDTPGFIGNRIGTYWLQCATVEALERNIDVESADAVLGKPAGVPKTGVFGLLDLVGLDLMPHILKSMKDTLPDNDPFNQLGGVPKLLQDMIDKGYTGRKGKGGFYRLNDKKQKEAIDLQTGDYYKAKRPTPAAAKAAKKSGLRALVTHDSEEGRYARIVLAKTFAYAASLVPEITDTVEQVDRAIRLGYNWKKGPFELMDKIGAEKLVDILEAENIPVPALLKKVGSGKFYKTENGQLHYFDLSGVYKPVRRPNGVLLLEDIKRKEKEPIMGNMSASVWDIGDGIACLEFHSKMNAFNPLMTSLIRKAVKELPKKGYKGMVIYNEASNFSVGANIAMILVAATLRIWPLVRWIIRGGQKSFQDLKYANFPIVAAPSGMALGGGCEVVLASHAVEAHAETYIGLVEVGVGIIPGWGGCKELLGRWATADDAKNGPMVAPMNAFETIATAQVAKSAEEAKSKKFLRPTDGIVMNRDRVLAAAKKRAQDMAADFKPMEPFTYRLPGASGAAALEMGVLEYAKKGQATPHDVTIGKRLAYVLSGGDTEVTRELTEEDILKLERDGLVALAKTKKSRARVKHMLFKGKPLRN